MRRGRVSLQESKARISEREQINALHDYGWACPCCGKDGVTEGCVWCGFSCQDGAHKWTLEYLPAHGEGFVSCRICGADGWRFPAEGKRPARIEF